MVHSICLGHGGGVGTIRFEQGGQYDMKTRGQSTNNMKLFKYFEQMNKVKIKKYFSKSLNYKNLLITSEYFSTFSSDIKKLAFLKNTFNNLGLKPIIIFYYRYDADYLYSFYTELLTHRKIIEIDSIFDFINKPHAYIMILSTINTILSK